jgi:hypothetical protein
LNIPVAHYELVNGFIRSKDFTNGASVNYEPAASVIGDRADYLEIYDAFLNVSPRLADAYVQIVYFDALIFKRLIMSLHFNCENSWSTLINQNKTKVRGVTGVFANIHNGIVQL